jgi:hypothetical protein
MRIHVFKPGMDVVRPGTRGAPTLRSPYRVALLNRAAWSAHLHAGESVSCDHGLLWLTQSNDGRDYFLRAGESFTVTSRGRVVVQALEESLFRVEETK